VAGWLQIIRDRAEPAAPASIHKSLVVAPAQFERLSTMCAAQAASWKTLPQLVEQPIRNLAKLIGAEVYGWNTPPDYAEAETILEQYPDSRMVFLVRDPFSVLLSYKYLPAYWGDERSRYNPVFQSVVWRQVIRKFEKVKGAHPGRVMLIRYEDLIRDPAKEVARISELCGARLSPPALDTVGSNSSRTGESGTGLTRIESWLCRSITGSVRSRLGYGRSAVPVLPELGVPAFAGCLLRSAAYYARQAVTSRDIRGRLWRFAKALVISRP
jgi:hypothetical protein